MRPGTYFNPQTEVMVVVDDSASMDSEIFNLEEFEGADWVLVSDDLPVDEAQRDELLESFQATAHGGDGRQTAARWTDADDVRRRGRRRILGRGREAPRGAAVDEERRRVGSRPVRPVYALGVFIPLAVVLELAHASPVLVFLAAALGRDPDRRGDGRGHRAPRRPDRPGIGGFLNVTFGNAPGADHRLLRAQGGPAGGREGLDRRLDHRQRAARARRGDAGRRPQAARSRRSTAPPPTRSRRCCCSRSRR